MKLSIIPVDGSVAIDNKIYNNLDLISCNIPEDVHALQWDEIAGWIEFNSPLTQNETITTLPPWAFLCIDKWDEANNPPAPPVPDPLPPTAQQNKQTAMFKLQNTDWTTIPDVSDPTKSNPYLSNVADFVVYRNAVRQYAINPIEGYINWPVAPQENWATTQG
jgi:hypothetical protein